MISDDSDLDDESTSELEVADLNDEEDDISITIEISNKVEHGAESTSFFSWFYPKTENLNSESNGILASLSKFSEQREESIQDIIPTTEYSTFSHSTETIHPLTGK